ncbi:LLM class flavin-dependent oxidoreductase [Phreatobacter sp.]|uniref:LLM class flavin-dependent oxidoreductase n=1 Tax=Phreatobacter sp. TaxID=1966341 RepID=UPI003F6FBF3C
MRIDLAGWTREATLMDHPAFLAIFEEADRLGFAGVWFNEFHFYDPPIPYPSVDLLAAAIFARTERLRVGSSIVILPLQHPLILAERIAQLDVQSGGRLDVGIGRGTSPETFVTLEIAPEEVRERFESAFRIIRDALTSAVASSQTGPWRFGPAVVGPVTVQRPHPPFYLAASSAETLAFGIDHDLPLLLSLEPPEGRQLALYRDLAAAKSRPLALSRSSLSRYVVIDATRQRAEARLDTLLAGLENRRRHFARAQGRPDPAPVDRATLLAERFVWGDPADCRRQIQTLERETGIGQLRCVFNGNGVLPTAVALEGMRLFATEVLGTV